MSFDNKQIAVIVPCFKVKSIVTSVIEKIGDEVDMIIVVDDGCPEKSGDYVLESVQDPRITLVSHQSNIGVGGAMISGYRKALAEGADILVKIDGDGQMDPTLIPVFLRHLIKCDADYVKGNRFTSFEDAREMPRIRLIGNLMLSFLTKLSSGYWNIVDPTNGFTALRSDVAYELPFDKIDKGFFFESDLLFYLYQLRAVVVDVPMRAVYGNEKSNLSIRKVSTEFLFKNVRNCMRRVYFTYFYNDFSLGSAELLFGTILFLFGIIFGSYAWLNGIITETYQSSGTVMLAALPTLMGLQLIIAFFNLDFHSTPKVRINRQDFEHLHRRDL